MFKRVRSNLYSVAGLGLGLCAVVVPGIGLASARPQVAAVVDDQVGQPNPVKDLTKTLCRRISLLGPHPKGTLLEASLVYEISGSTLSLDQKVVALADLRRLCPVEGLNYVIGGIDRALRSGGASGTAGLSDGYGNEPSSFTAPTINVGGGSVNYRSAGGR